MFSIGCGDGWNVVVGKNLATSERKRSKREAKAVKLRIQREKDKKRDRAEREE